jgi:hypothetical protein
MKKEQKRKRLRKKKIKLMTIVGRDPVQNGNTKKRVLIWPVPVKDICEANVVGV